jgi:hypothetical protein
VAKAPLDGAVIDLEDDPDLFDGNAIIATNSCAFTEFQNTSTVGAARLITEGLQNKNSGARGVSPILIARLDLNLRRGIVFTDTQRKAPPALSALVRLSDPSSGIMRRSQGMTEPQEWLRKTLRSNVTP